MLFETTNKVELLVKKGLPLILILILIGVLISIVIIKLILKKDYFNYVTEILIELFDCEEYKLINLKDSKILKTTRTYINAECNFIRIDPTCKYIQLPYYTRFMSYIIFWGYFSIQTLFLEEIFTNEDQSGEDGFKCFNLTTKLIKSLYRCEKYGIKSIDSLFKSMDEIAGILALHEFNKFVFRKSFNLFKFILNKNFFIKFRTKLKDQFKNDKIPLFSFTQLSYMLIISYLSYVIYDNIVTEYYYIPIRLVCYSVLVYATILSSFETVKYLIAYQEINETNLPVLVNLSEENDENQLS